MEFNQVSRLGACSRGWFNATLRNNKSLEVSLFQFLQKLFVYSTYIKHTVRYVSWIYLKRTDNETNKF